MRPATIALGVTVALHAPVVILVARAHATPASAPPLVLQAVAVDLAPPPSARRAVLHTAREGRGRGPRATRASVAQGRSRPLSVSRAPRAQSPVEAHFEPRTGDVLLPIGGDLGASITFGEPIRAPGPPREGALPTGGQQEARRVFSSTEVDVAPRRRSGAAPRYPQLEALNGREGWVLLEIVVSADGAPEDVSLLECHGAKSFGAAACEAVRAWRFDPALRAGKAVACVCTQRLAFKLDDRR